MLDRADHNRRRVEARRRRDRAYRARRDAGVFTLNIQLDGEALNWLVHCHAIDPRVLELTDMRAMRQAIGEAVTQLLAASRC
jgi:hypothetical protein